MGQIGREQGCSRSMVSHYLIEHEIPVREDRLPSIPVGQLAFGEKIRGGQIVSHLGERAIIRELIVMRGQGRSYGELVKWLNARKIPSKNGRPWARTTVLKILRRASEVDGNGG